MGGGAPLLQIVVEVTSAKCAEHLGIHLGVGRSVRVLLSLKVLKLLELLLDLLILLFKEVVAALDLLSEVRALDDRQLKVDPAKLDNIIHLEMMD